jgi:hypothetical protein
MEHAQITKICDPYHKHKLLHITLAMMPALAAHLE